MGLLERMQNKGRSTPDSLPLDSSIPGPDEPVVFQRMDRVITFVTGMVPGGSKGSPIVKRVVSEMVEEIRDVPPEMVELYVRQISALLHWVATGETLGDIPLPAGFEE